MLTMQRSVLSFIVILVFGVGAAIFVVKKGNDAAEELERLNRGIFLVHRVSLADKSDNGISDTSNWKIYRNEKYGFEMRYPPDFFLFSSTRAAPKIVSPTAESRIVKITDKEEMLHCCEPFIFSIEVLDYVDNLEQFIKDANIIHRDAEWRIQKRGYESFAGEKAYRIYSSTGLDSAGNIIMFNHNNHSFLIRSTTLDNQFGKILNTFIFIK